MLNQILRPVARRVLRKGTQTRYSHDHHASDFKYVTMDEAIVPQGSWQENYDKLQRKYNLQLVAGVVSLVLTCVAINRFELLFFNYGPPKPKQ